MSDIPASSGIYKITCIANGRFYIGSAINLHKRKIQHWTACRRNEHDNPKLQNAWNKYGEQVFTFEILELVLPMSLTVREQYWFKKLKPFGRKGFNIQREAGSPLGIKRSLEAIEKMKQSHLGKYEQAAKASEAARKVNLGRERSPETKKRISETRLRLGLQPSPETIAAAKQANIGRKHTAEVSEKHRQANLGRQRDEGGRFV